jgi:uroporphyrinogen decarboxylase
MTGRERVLKALYFEEPDQIALLDAPWGTTIERWYNEGLPRDVGPGEYFGYNFIGVGPDTSFRFPYELIEETDEYRIDRDGNGAVHRNWKSKTSTPECIDFLIKTPTDWEEHKARLAFSPDRVDLEGARNARKIADEKGYFYHFTCGFGYDKTQGIVGSERLLMAMADEPEWVAEMLLVSAQMIVDAAKHYIENGIVFDGAWMYNDMGYRNGSMFSPKMYRALQMPADRLVYDFFHENGLKCILHSCGNVREIVPDMIEAGLDCLQPLEVKAGMDVIEMKKSFHGKLSMMGGIDVRAMGAEDPAVIEEEIATKIPAAMAGGGYIYHSDHSVPDNISFERYEYVMELVKAYGTYK